MAFIVKRDTVVIPAGIPVASTASVVMNLTRFGSSSTLTLVKKSTQGEFLGNSSGTGDTFYLVSGIIYKFVYILSGTDYGSEYLIAPNASIGSDPNNADWIVPNSYWRIFQFYSDDGTTFNYFGYNSSTSTTTIPTVGWTLDPQGDTYVTAVSITAA